MSQYIARRLLLALPVLVGVSLLVFVMSRVLPGDAFVARAGTSGITPQQRAQYRKEAGLDRPLVTQYLDWGWHAIRLDFGQSLWNRRSVNGELGRALPITVELTVLAAIMGLVVAMPLGVVSAAMQGSPVDHVARVFGVLGLSIPSYVLGSLTITYLAHWFHWTPPAGGVSFVGHPWRNMQQFLIPSAILGAGFSAAVVRLTRSSVLGALHERLRSYSLGEGAAGAPGAAAARAAQRDDPGPHAGGGAGRVSARRDGHHRDDLHAFRGRSACV